MVNLRQKPKFAFECLLGENGYSSKVVDELWKRYDFSEKKGVASFSIADSSDNCLQNSLFAEYLLEMRENCSIKIDGYN
jgi:hypothetical protein